MSNCITHSKSVHLLPLGSKHTVQLVPENTFHYKLEVSRLDSRLSSFVIISSYVRTLSIRKQKNYKMPVSLATCVLNMEYVITSCTYCVIYPACFQSLQLTLATQSDPTLSSVNYLKKFSPVLPELSEPLRRLCKSGVKWA